MEDFDFQQYPRSPPSDARTPSQHLNGPLSPPLFLEYHSLLPPPSPPSPSPDIQAILEQISSRDRELSCLSDDPHVRTADCYLDYVSRMLMYEDEEASPPPDDAQASYYTILRSLCDIIRQPLPVDLTSFQDSSTSLVESSSFPLSLHVDENHSASSLRRSSNDGQSTHMFEACGQHSSLGKGGNGLDGEVRSALFEANDRTKISKIINSVDTSFEGLRMEDDYVSLYLGALSLSDSTNARKATCRNEVKRISSKAARQNRKRAQNAFSESVDFVCLTDLLVSSAQAMAMGNVKRVNQILNELYVVHGVSPDGNCMQRLAHYFCDALVTRIAKIEGQQSLLTDETIPPVASILNPFRILYKSVPMMKVAYYFANQQILKVAERCARLHILDFGIMHGMQWPCLIKALADRDGGPPMLVITGIEMPWPGGEKLKETGQRLASYASRCNVRFEFHALISDKWENIDPNCLQLHKGEVLVINTDSRLNLVPDEFSDSSSFGISPRDRLFTNLRSLNPHLLLTGDFNLAGNSPFFVTRFREVLQYFHSHVDMLYTLCSNESDRYTLQGSLYRWSIRNIVAFEGAERVKRPESFKQWDLRLKRAGFELLRLPSSVMSTAVLYAKKHYHRDFMVLQDANGWLLLGWKGRVLQASAAWKPT